MYPDTILNLLLNKSEKVFFINSSTIPPAPAILLIFKRTSAFKPKFLAEEFDISINAEREKSFLDIKPFSFINYCKAIIY